MADFVARGPAIANAAAGGISSPIPATTDPRVGNRSCWGLQPDTGNRCDFCQQRAGAQTLTSLDETQRRHKLHFNVDAGPRTSARPLGSTPS
jgi:hypothetical protein